MGNRCDYGVDVTVRIAWRSDNDRAGAILRAFDTAPVMFGTPKKTIANDKTWALEPAASLRFHAIFGSFDGGDRVLIEIAHGQDFALPALQ